VFRQDPDGCGRQLNIPEVPVSFLEVQISCQPIGKNGPHGHDRLADYWFAAAYAWLGKNRAESGPA